MTKQSVHGSCSCYYHNYDYTTVTRKELAGKDKALQVTQKPYNYVSNNSTTNNLKLLFNKQHPQRQQQITNHDNKNHNNNWMSRI